MLLVWNMSIYVYVLYWALLYVLYCWETTTAAVVVAVIIMTLQKRERGREGRRYKNTQFRPLSDLYHTD